MVSENNRQLSNRDCNQLRLAKNSRSSRNRNLPKESEIRGHLKKVCTVSVSTKSVITTETIPKNHPAYIKDQIARQSRLSRQIGKSDLSLSSKPLKKSGHGLSNIHKDAQGRPERRRSCPEKPTVPIYREKDSRKRARSVSTGPSKKPRTDQFLSIEEKKTKWEGKIQEKLEKISSNLTEIETLTLFGQENPLHVTKKLTHLIVKEIFHKCKDETKVFHRCKDVFLNLGRPDSKNFYLCLVTNTFKVEDIPTMDTSEWRIERKIEKLEQRRKFIQAALAADSGSKARDPSWVKTIPEYEDVSPAFNSRPRSRG